MIQRLAAGGILRRPNPVIPGGSVVDYSGAILRKDASFRALEILESSDANRACQRGAAGQNEKPAESQQGERLLQDAVFIYI
jgi:hypothetical protein